MPKAYEAMRDKFESEGMDEKKAKSKAAKIYNSKHKGHPLKKDKKNAPYFTA